LAGHSAWNRTDYYNSHINRICFLNDRLKCNSDIFTDSVSALHPQRLWCVIYLFIFLYLNVSFNFWIYYFFLKWVIILKSYFLVWCPFSGQMPAGHREYIQIRKLVSFHSILGYVIHYNNKNQGFTTLSITSETIDWLSISPG
jgi:hypothetical protein